MKNIITIIIILVLPVMTYLILEKRSSLATTSTTEKNLPTLMIFSSSMCIDCQKLKSVIKEIEPIYAGRINIVSYNALDKDKKIKNYIKQYGIVLAPTTIILDKNGRQIDKIEGYLPKDEYINEIEEAINE